MTGYISKENLNQELNDLLLKLVGIEESANNYVLPQASQTVMGGVKIDNSTIQINEAGEIYANAGGQVTPVTVVDNLTSTSATDALSANQGKVLNDKITAHTDNADIHITPSEKQKLAGIADNANNYVLPEATTTVLGGVKADGTTISVANGVISAVIPTVETPKVSHFDTTVSVDATYEFIYTPTVTILPTDKLMVFYNSTAVKESQFSIVEVGGQNVIALSLNESSTLENNHVYGMVFRGFDSI